MKYTLNWIVKTVLTSLVMVAFAASAAETNTFWVADLDLRAVEQDFAVARKDATFDGHPLSVGGKKFEHGLGTHANSSMYISLNGQREC